METRNISVTLEQAIKWYNSGNATLRELALNAYTKEELELDYNSIDREVNQICTCICIPKCEGKKFQVLAKLATIAKFYNKDWKKTACNTGYFIGNYNNGNSPAIDIYTKMTAIRILVYINTSQHNMQELYISGTLRMLSKQSRFLVMKSRNYSNRKYYKVS